MLDKAQLKMEGLAFGHSIQTAFKNVSIYSLDHPATSTATQNAFKCLTGLFKHLPQFTFGFTEGRLLIHDLLTEEKSLRQLQVEFTRRGIAALTFLKEITFTDFTHGLTILTTRPKEIDAKGGIKAFLLENPIHNIRVAPFQRVEKGDMVLGMDSESYLMTRELLNPQGGQVIIPEILLKHAQTANLSGETLQGTDVVKIAGQATEAGLSEQTLNPNQLMAAVAQLVQQMTPESFLASLPSDRQAELRGHSADEIAANVVEDSAVRAMASRLAKQSSAPLADEAHDVALRVMKLGLDMTSVAERYLSKLARVLKESDAPPDVFERVQSWVQWSGLPEIQQHQRLMQTTQNSADDFRRLLEYVNACLDGKRFHDVREVTTHYFAFLEDPTADLKGSLTRAPELLRAVAVRQTISCFHPIAERLATALLDEGKLDPDCHRLTAACLFEIMQTAVSHGNFDLVHRIGTVFAQSMSRSTAHAECCGKAWQELLSAPIVVPLVTAYLENRPDASVKTIVDLLGWRGVSGAEEVFPLLVEEPLAPRRLRLLHLLGQLGPAARDAARKRLADDRWYVIRNACCVLAEVGEPEAPRRLQHALRHADQRVQSAAVMAFVKSRGPGLTEALVEALPGMMPHVAEMALNELAIRKDPAALGGIGRFIELSKGGKSSAVLKAISLLAALPSEWTVRELGTILWDQSHTVAARRAAADALLTNPMPEARRLLESFAERGPTDPLATTIQQALRRER